MLVSLTLLNIMACLTSYVMPFSSFMQVTHTLMHFPVPVKLITSGKEQFEVDVIRGIDHSWAKHPSYDLETLWRCCSDACYPPLRKGSKWVETASEEIAGQLVEHITGDDELPYKCCKQLCNAKELLV